jgi:predicted nuclease of predicted toxin-antitoxin system
VRFLLDMNLPPAMADWLKSIGHDAVHVLASGLAELSDRELFVLAAEQQRILVTFDLDFGEIAGFAGEIGCGVILLRLRLASQSYLRGRLVVAVAQAQESLEAGAFVLVEDTRIRIRRMPLDRR